MVEVSMRNLDEFTITDEALRRIAATPDTRIKEIMTSLIRHLHDFARDVRLTEPEWLAGILFLTRTVHLCSDVRQEFILLSDTLGLSQLVVAHSHSRPENVSQQTVRSEEQKSELQSLIRNSYAFFCLTKQTRPVYS